MISNYMFETLPESGGSVVVGFENHSGKTYLGEGVSPLHGKMLKGYGNNGEDQTEGARYKNVFGTYSHWLFYQRTRYFAILYYKLPSNANMAKSYSPHWTTP